jgi:hypothetical protein
MLSLGYTGYCCVTLTKGETKESFCFLSAVHSNAKLRTLFVQVAKTVATDLRLAAQRGKGKKDSVTVFLPDAYECWTNTSISPFGFVHDMPQIPECDAEYSWLWIKRQPHIRLLLSGVHEKYRKVRVIVPNAHSTENLLDARLLLNGEVVNSKTEVWSEGCGAISAELPDTLAEPLVLGFWVPNWRMSDDGTTKLYACIDRIELSA